jgi:hypothetical protein
MYTPTEFTLMLRVAGSVVEQVWGGTAGNWRREPMDLDEYELMAVARKKSKDRFDGQMGGRKLNGAVFFFSFYPTLPSEFLLHRFVHLTDGQDGKYISSNGFNIRGPIHNLLDDDCSSAHEERSHD